MFTKWIPLVLALASVGVITSIVAADLRNAERACFDPILNAGSQCRPLAATSPKTGGRCSG